MPTFVTCILYCTVSFIQGNRARKQYKGYPDEKGYSKAIFTNNMIYCLENAEEFTHIHESSTLMRSADTKSRQKKNQLHFYSLTRKKNFPKGN